MQVLWSPMTWGNATPTDAQMHQIERGLDVMFGELTRPLAVHFQDTCGQSVTFAFPFYYNYSIAHTCEKDVLPAWRFMQRLAAR